MNIFKWIYIKIFFECIHVKIYKFINLKIYYLNVCKNILFILIYVKIYYLNIIKIYYLNLFM